MFLSVNLRSLFIVGYLIVVGLMVRMLVVSFALLIDIRKSF